MFNRSTKMTALLVAAASIMTTVPAMAASKTYRLATKDGRIESASSFKGGKYIFQGYKDEDNDDNGVYYNSGSGKDKYLDKVDRLNETQTTGAALKYSDRYVQAFDGSEEYIVDLETGKASEDDVLSVLEASAEKNLVNKLKRTDKYNDISELAHDLVRVNNGQFGDVWYEYAATTGEAVAYGYTNSTGRDYVDASYDMNLYAYNEDHKMVKLDHVGSRNGSVKLERVEHRGTIGQDKDHIYRLIEAYFTGAKSVKTDGELESCYYVQKISKAVGSDDDKDAKLPKTTECFALGTVDRAESFDNEDMETALKELKALVKQDSTAKATINGDYIYVTDWDGHDSDSKVKTFKLKFKSSEKFDRKDGDYKVGAKVLKKDGDKDEDCDDWSMDVNGSIWTIKDGKIKKSVKAGDFEKVYTCDTSMDSIDVYDDDNLIAWDRHGDVYTTVQEGKKGALDEATELTGGANKVETPVVTDGWKQDAAGNWTFVKGGVKVTGWFQDGAKWYYMDAAGNMQTGWVAWQGKWYYLNPVSDGTKGAMKTGWVYDTTYGAWYYLQGNGAMATGWYQDTTGTWYYSYANGKMAANTVIGGYKLGANGAWVR